MMTKYLSPSNLLFSTTLILSTMMIITSSNWIMIWMSMEMNLMSFIPLIIFSSSYREIEAATKYFLIQSIGSALMLTTIFIFYSSTLIFISSLLFCFSMSLKMGMAPLHLWFPQVLSIMSWPMILVAATWQKVGPMSILSYSTSLWDYQILIIMATMNALVGTWGGLSQTQLRPLIAYSSISHMGWMLSSMIISSNMMIIYLIFYSIVTLSVIIPLIFMEKQSTAKFNLTNFSSQYFSSMTALNILSMGGMPPMVGFFPKWLVISSLIYLTPTLTLILTTSSMLSLYFYLKIMMTVTMNTSKSMSLKSKSSLKAPFLYLTFPHLMLLIY
uniref:NADH-ubiquinone oxidoreductase chain 2 n=1 Tax=Typosyllis sp. patternB TaxID=1898411 RepID=A0A1C9UZE3_9ANNE|nr:NADH dehydrogenase subunit 2 [Typosyllis sp. patternB]